MKVKKVKWLVFALIGVLLLAGCATEMADKSPRPELPDLESKADLPEAFAPADAVGEVAYSAEDAQHRSPEAEAVVIRFLRSLRHLDWPGMMALYAGDEEPLEVILDFAESFLWWAFIPDVPSLGDFEEYWKKLDFRCLEILGAVPPEALAVLYTSERTQGSLSRQARELDVERLVSVVVAFEVRGERYLILANVADFGGRWYITSFSGHIGAMIGLSPWHRGLIPLMRFDEEAYYELWSIVQGLQEELN